MVMFVTVLSGSRLGTRPQAEPSIPPSTPQQLERANALIEQGQFGEAASIFKGLLISQPDSPLVYNLLGFCYLKQGLEEDAMQSFKNAVALDPKFKPAHNNLGGLYLVRGEPKEAIAEFLAVIRIDPKDFGAYSNLAQAELAADQPAAAIQHLRQSRNPKATEILYAWAVESFKRQRYKTTIVLLKEVAPSMQQSAAWHGLLGESYYKLGDLSPAAVEFQKAMTLDPHNQDYVLELGEIFVAHNNGKAAAALLEPATRAFPDSARIWFGLGVAHLAASELAAAESALRRSLQLDPTLDLAEEVLCQGYEEAGKWDQLEQTASRLIQLNPKNSMGYYYQAMALLRSSSVNDAQVERLLRKSVELGSNDSDPRPRYELAKILLKEGRRDACIRELEEVVRTSPTFGPAHFQLARLYREDGKLVESEREQKAYETARQQRGKPLRQVLVEIH